MIWQVVSGQDDPTHFSFGMGAAVDARGNVYQAAYTMNLSLPRPCNFPFINKYDSNGTLLWTVNFLEDSACGIPSRVVVDPGGFIYVAGDVINPADFTSQLILEKLTFDGRLQWRQIFGPTRSLDNGVGLAFDAARGIVHVLDARCLDLHGPCWLQYNGDGTLLSQQKLAFADSLVDIGIALTMDNAGVTVLSEADIAGRDSSGNPGFVTRVTRYNLSGAITWMNLTTLSPLLNSALTGA